MGGQNLYFRLYLGLTSGLTQLENLKMADEHLSCIKQGLKSLLPENDLRKIERACRSDLQPLKPCQNALVLNL